MIDRTLTVRTLATSERGAQDVALNAVDHDGQQVSLAWSSRTGELFTFREQRPGIDVVLDVLGRLDSYHVAFELVDATRLPFVSGGGEISLVMLRVQLNTGAD